MTHEEYYALFDGNKERAIRYLAEAEVFSHYDIAGGHKQTGKLVKDLTGEEAKRYMYYATKTMFQDKAIKKDIQKDSRHTFSRLLFLKMDPDDITLETKNPFAKSLIIELIILAVLVISGIIYFRVLHQIADPNLGKYYGGLLGVVIFILLMDIPRFFVFRKQRAEAAKDAFRHSNPARGEKGKNGENYLKYILDSHEDQYQKRKVEESDKEICYDCCIPEALPPKQSLAMELSISSVTIKKGDPVFSLTGIGYLPMDTDRLFQPGYNKIPLDCYNKEKEDMLYLYLYNPHQEPQLPGFCTIAAIDTLLLSRDDVSFHGLNWKTNMKEALDLMGYPNGGFALIECECYKITATYLDESGNRLRLLFEYDPKKKDPLLSAVRFS